MRREDFEKVRGLRKELEDLERRKKHPAPKLQTIFYKDYRTGKGVPKTDVGYDDGAEELGKLIRQIAKVRAQTMRRILDAEKALEAVEDPEMRTILRRYYFDGATQHEIAQELAYSRGRIAQRLNAFWATQKEEPHEEDKKLEKNV